MRKDYSYHFLFFVNSFLYLRDHGTATCYQSIFPCSYSRHNGSLVRIWHQISPGPRVSGRLTRLCVVLTAQDVADLVAKGEGAAKSHYASLKSRGSKIGDSIGDGIEAKSF